MMVINFHSVDAILLTELGLTNPKSEPNDQLIIKPFMSWIRCLSSWENSAGHWVPRMESKTTQIMTYQHSNPHLA